jgi:predicted ATPase/DNA-binding SARP family transcriptional activator
VSRAGTDWSIRLLGSFRVVAGDVTVPAGQWRLRKAKSLVAMLALAPGQRRHREQVLDRLWPDLEPLAAAKNLHQTLYVARRAIGVLRAPAPGLLAIHDDEVVLDEAGSVEVDVFRFEQSAVAALRTGDESMLRAAADLYAGDLLPDLPDAEWLTGLRGELRETHCEILVKLATAVQDSAPEEALITLTRVLESNALHEGAVRVLMLVLARLGRRSEALARYELLADDLLEAYGTDPDTQSAALFRELLTGSAVAQRREVADATEESIGFLPMPLTSFIGRTRELVDVERLLGQARLLTLTGAGGSGKTRLALEVARAVRSSYRDGVWFVDLAAVGESWLVADAVAEALMLDCGSAADRGKALVAQLRARGLLIVLDNCEHLLAGCAHLVADVLLACPGVDVLATSREALHAHGEYTFRVPSLALPPHTQDEALDLAHLGQLASVRLFVERAGQVRPGFSLDSGNMPGVVELCRRLDGMPLALELAAARVAVLEPVEIVERLDQVLSVLGGGLSGITRHQTMRGTLEWSHDLLTEPERVLLRRLSAFSGGFTLPAVEAVCDGAPLGGAELFDLLVRLVDKSLVVPEKAATGTRYRQLESVRQFGGEKLTQAGEAEQLAAAHCAYFLAFAVAHNPERSSGVVIEAPKLLDPEHDNLRAALRWSCAHEPVTALRLAASLWRFWFVRGHAVEGAHWLERALAGATAPTRPRAAALIGLTGLDSRQGRSDRHRPLGAEAMAIMRQIGDRDEVVMAQIVEATLAWSTFDLSEAEQMAAEVRAVAVERGRAEHAAAGSWILAHCALFREDGPLATHRLETCLGELAQSAASRRPFMPVITPCLQLVPIAGRLVPSIEETMLLGRRVGVGQATGYVLSALGYASRLSGDPDSASSVVAEAVEQFAELGDELARAQALHQLGCIHRDSGNYRAAMEALSSARSLRLVLGDRRGELLTETNVALLDSMSGDSDRGLASARHTLAVFESAGDHVGVGAALTALAAIELLTGETRAAREMYSQAAGRCAPWRRISGWLRLMVAELSIELDDPRRAAREVATADLIFDRTSGAIVSERLAAVRPGAD